MKVLSKEGRFQFIKNQQVSLDKSLKKYKELEIIKKVHELKESDGASTQGVAYDADATLPFVCVDEMTKAGDVDEELRNIINSLVSNNVVKYLKSDNAIEFNQKFAKILKGEVRFNDYSLQVVTPNWVYEDEVRPIKVGDKNMSFCDKLSLLFKNINAAIKETRKISDKNKNEEDDAVSVIEFFNTIHVMNGKEKEFVDRISGYFQLYENASKMNQTAQMDAIAQKIIIDIYESILFVHGYNKYIEFGELEKLNVPGGKVVDIDYIKNYGRTIPTDIVEKKVACDDMCVFDNYCVMYYDPEGTTYQKTSDAKRDPILFGLINHSNKLYYVADWEDELCDLTLEKIAEQCSVNTIE